MTDPTPASDALVAELREAHVPTTLPTLVGVRCSRSGHRWPCRTASLIARLDEAEADRDRAVRELMLRVEDLAAAQNRQRQAEADRDRWKARAEAAEESLVDGLRSVAADDRHYRFAPDPHLCAPCEAARLLAIYRERLTPDTSGPVEGGE